jgi:hypothetical protein
VTTPETVESVAGYTPPAVDLSPFRAGTVWHYSYMGWLVTSLAFSEEVAHHQAKPLTGDAFNVKVMAGTLEVRMTLERAEWADRLPTTRNMDGFDQFGFDQFGFGPHWLFSDTPQGGQCWTVSDFLSVHDSFGGFPDSLPSRLEVTLWRNPLKDLTP